jgi:hypothetical protein
VAWHYQPDGWSSERKLLPLDVLARQAADLIERDEVEAALRESKAQFR